MYDLLHSFYFPLTFFLFSAQVYDRLLITSWGHDPGVVPTSNVLTMLNDALTHSAVLIQVSSELIGSFSFQNFLVLLTICVLRLQGHGVHGHGETVHIPFPFDQEDLKAGESCSRLATVAACTAWDLCAAACTTRRLCMPLRSYTNTD